MRMTRTLIALALLPGLALAQTPPPRALSGADVAAALNNGSIVLPAARLPTGPGGVALLGSDGKVPAALIPAGSGGVGPAGPAGPAGAAGTAGIAGAQGIAGAAGVAGAAGATGPAGPVVAATATTLGGVKCGTGLLCASDGTANVDSVTPTTLSGSPQATDGILMLRGGVSYLVPFSAFSAAPAATATAFGVALGAASGVVGSPVSVSVAPTGGTWPSAETLTFAATGVSGAFNPATTTPTAGSTTASVSQFTPSAAGSGTIAVSASPAMTAPAGQAFTATAAATGNAMALTGATFAAAPTGFGQQITAGAGTATIAVPVGSFTLELWVTSPPVAAGGGSFTGFLDLQNGSTLIAAMAIDGAGNLFGEVNSATTSVASGTSDIANNARHFVSLSYDSAANAAYIHANGNEFASIAAPGATIAATSIKIMTPPGGAIDELRVSSVSRYGNAAYTAPTAPFTTDTGSVAIYHLDGNGTAN